MSTTAQKAILTAKIEGVLKELMIKTSAEQVYLDYTTTLASKLSELIDALNGKASQSEVSEALSARPTNEAMNNAISNAIDELIGGAPSTYDTLKEISDYISEHEEVVDALNAAIGKKADASVVTALQEVVSAIQSTVNGLGSMATKNSVSYSDLDLTLKGKIDTAESKSKIFYSSTQPTDLEDGDLWVKLLD
ncbi:MAG: hypothetical protein PUG66_07975 [Clostridiales bacterium]|nr:hypothetical protein [Eubacterium sp.]MDD7349759.1 hypothetical protein [Clostridiales bacterium]